MRGERQLHTQEEGAIAEVCNLLDRLCLRGLANGCADSFGFLFRTIGQLAEVDLAGGWNRNGHRVAVEASSRKIRCDCLGCGNRENQDDERSQIGLQM